LIVRQPDASDGRRTRIALTREGRAALDADRAARDGWLGGEISKLTADEQEVLRQAAPLIDRIANSA
jgi:DNA-binding MarR family transcriptional regulator